MDVPQDASVEFSTSVWICNVKEAGSISLLTIVIQAGCFVFTVEDMTFRFHSVLGD